MSEAISPSSHKSTFELISDCVEQAKQGLQELSAKVADFDAANATAIASDTATIALASAMEKANGAIDTLAATSLKLKDAASEVPTQALVTTISSANDAIQWLQETAIKFDNDHQLSSKLAAAIAEPRDKVHGAVAAMAAYAAEASHAANAKLQGLADGLVSSLSKAAISGLDKALPIAAEADKKYGVAEKAAAAGQQAQTIAKELDDKYKVTETAKTYAEKYELENKARQAMAQVQGLDQQYMGGRMEAALNAAYVAGLGLAGFVAEKYSQHASKYPSCTLKKGGMEVLVYLPCHKSGYYRSTRFDWSGMIAQVSYQDHKYFKEWISPHDPTIYEHGVGPCEEFGLEEDPPLFSDCKIGDTFVKIGVGVLKKTTEEYSFREHYPFVEHGEWKLETSDSCITFKQELEHKTVKYVLTKKVEITDKAGELMITHSLFNLGMVPIKTTHYNHAFVSIDDRDVDQSYQTMIPFASEEKEVTIENPGFAFVKGKTIDIEKPLADKTVLWQPLSGYEDSTSTFTVFNTESQAGVKFDTNKSPVKFNWFAVKTAVCPEPFVAIDLEPGKDMEWTTTLTFGNKASVQC